MSSDKNNRTIQEQLTAAQKTIAVLLDRVEQSTDAAGDLQALEVRVSERHKRA